jgi:hypothetical protein
MRSYNIESEFNKMLETGRMPIFEVKVINKATKEVDYITFDISIDGNTIKAQHVALTVDQDNSNKIAFIIQHIDGWFSLDEHLQDLYSTAIESIMNSDYFTLTEN